MGNPYIKPAPPPGYNNNPPSDDNAQTTDNSVSWQKHLDKIGDPLNTHTTGEADATEAAFAVRLLNGVIRTAVTYQVVSANRGKVIEGTANGIIINLPDVTVPDIGVGWEIAISALINGGTGSITVKPSGSQTINGETELVFQSGNFALLTSDGTNWLALIHTAPEPAPTPALIQEYISPEQTITTAGTLTLPHGMTTTPKFCIPALKFVVAEAGFAIGEEIDYWPTQSYVGGTPTGRGVVFSRDATNIFLRYGNALEVFDCIHKTTGAFVLLNNTSIRLIVKAYA